MLAANRKEVTLKCKVVDSSRRKVSQYACSKGQGKVTALSRTKETGYLRAN